LNGNAILPLWIGAVLAGNFAGISNHTLNVASAIFIALRVSYNYIYTNATTAAASRLRTIVWLLSMGVPLYLLVKSGNIVRSKGA